MLARRVPTGLVIGGQPGTAVLKEHSTICDPAFFLLQLQTPFLDTNLVVSVHPLEVFQAT